MRKLPGFRGIQQVVKVNQDTKDIITEVLSAHQAFRKDYDIILDYFPATDPLQLAKKLFRFCKENIRYRVESDKLQTTRSPAGILYLKNGDCKHYAGFVAGVLDAWRRYNKEKFSIYYRFASYDIFERIPAHVFVILIYNGKEYWIDPVLKSFDIREPAPTYFNDKLIPMALVRISGLTHPQNYPISMRRQIGDTLPVPTNKYDLAAKQLSSVADVAVSQIPFVSLAQGLLSSFFGKGGLSDWLSPSGIINEFKAAIFGRMYRGGQYWLGEKFRYYILGEDIHTRDADVVTDQAVGTAITTFSVGFGVPIEDYQDIINLDSGPNAYVSRYVALGANSTDIDLSAVQRAVDLKRTYFPSENQGNYSASGVPPQKWDPNNFNRIPYAAPIPDFTKPYSEMFKNTYTGAIPGGEVKNGIVISGPLAGGALAAGKQYLPYLLIGAAVIGGYFLLRKKRRYY